MNLTPQALQESLNKISDESFEKHQELAGLAALMDGEWLELRKECKTDKECDRRLGATKDGKRLTFLKIYLQGLSHKRTALILEYKSNANLNY